MLVLLLLFYILYLFLCLWKEATGTAVETFDAFRNTEISKEGISFSETGAAADLTRQVEGRHRPCHTYDTSSMT